MHRFHLQNNLKWKFCFVTFLSRYLLNPAARHGICCRGFSAAGFCSVPLSALSVHSIIDFRTVITSPSLFASSVQCHCTAALG